MKLEQPRKQEKDIEAPEAEPLTPGDIEAFKKEGKKAPEGRRLTRDKALKIKKEEEEEKLKEQYKVLAEGRVPPEERKEKKEPKIPQRKNLWESLQGIKDERKRQEKFEKIIKTFQEGERVYSSKGGKLQYYLKLITKDVLLDENAELTFVIYDENDQPVKFKDGPNKGILERKVVKLGKLKYRKWEKITKEPTNNDLYVEEKDGSVKQWTKVDPKPSSDELREYEGVYKKAILSRSARRFKAQKEKLKPQKKKWWQFW